MAGARSERYTTTAIVLHWVVGIAILVLIGLGWYMVDIPKKTPERAFFFNLHKSIGVTVAAFVLLRILWRVFNAPPPLPRSIPAWQIAAAKWTHALLYLCMVLMPVFGFVGSNFGKYGVKYFGLQVGPFFPEDAAMVSLFQSFHRWTSYVLVALIALHVAAALKHAIVDRSGVLRRMLP
jgi:cytochrome b561